MTSFAAEALKEANVVACDGSRVGSVEYVYLDQETVIAGKRTASPRRPEWIAIKTGLFGKKRRLVPLASAERVGNDLRVPYEKVQVKDAPSIKAGRATITTEEEESLFRYWMPNGHATPALSP